jgi:hypothetical protein
LYERKPSGSISDRSNAHSLVCGPALDLRRLADPQDKAIHRVKQTLVRIVGNRADREQAEKLAEVLASGAWTHDYAIAVSEARNLGIPLGKELAQDSSAPLSTSTSRGAANRDVIVAESSIIHHEHGRFELASAAGERLRK